MTPKFLTRKELEKLIHENHALLRFVHQVTLKYFWVSVGDYEVIVLSSDTYTQFTPTPHPHMIEDTGIIEPNYPMYNRARS